jgi:diguanylate cyclase
VEYHDSIEKSAEYLRLALQMMTKQAAGLHPVSYAVWYEYVASINPGLRKRVDELTQNNQVLDEQTVHQLYRDHVAEIDEAVAQRVSQGFEKVMVDISSSTAQAANEAGHFGKLLKNWSDDLATGKNITTLSHGIADLLHYSRNMQQTVQTLNARLDESHREVEALRQEVNRAREEASIDGLTGLANRRSFDRALASHLARSGAESHGPSLLIADIDHFKRINDSYGHVFGDKVIRSIATILRDNVKGKDLAARYGGEEFVVVLPDTPIEGARSLAEKIRKIVEGSRIKRVGNNEIVANVTISLGVACRHPGETDQELVSRADAALYQSKQQGRNRVTLAAACA